MAKNNGASSSAIVQSEVVESDLVSINAEALAKLSSLSKTEFKQVESDLWKPTEKDEQLTGIYLGKSPSSFTDKNTGEIVPFIELLTKSEIDNSPMVMRILEKAALKRVFDTLKINTAVRIVYEGSMPSKQGNPVQLFTVFREYSKL